MSFVIRFSSHTAEGGVVLITTCPTFELVRFSSHTAEGGVVLITTCPTFELVRVNHNRAGNPLATASSFRLTDEPSTYLSRKATLFYFRRSSTLSGTRERPLAGPESSLLRIYRRVDENWAEGRLEQRVGIFPIAFVELNQPARHLVNSTPLNRPVPPLPEHARAGQSDHRHHAQHSHRYQPMSMSTPTTGQGNYQNMATMSQSHPNYHATHMIPQPQIMVPQPAPHVISHGGVVTASPRNIIEPAQTKHSLDLIHFTNMHNKSSHQGTMGIQSVSRIGENYDRLRAVKYDSYNSTPVHKNETTYQNVRTHEHFPVSVANFNANNVSSDSSSSVNTASVVSSTTTPNTSSDTSTCESAEPSLPSSPDNNTERNATVVASNTTQQNATEEETNENPDSSLNASMGVLSLNESSTATNTSLNVSLPPAESPKLNASANSTQNHNDIEATSSERLDAPSSSKVVARSSGPDSLLNFGLGLQAALSPSHGKDGNYMSAEDRGERRRRRERERSGERPLPAAYIALYPYKPQKHDELELKKGAQPMSYPWSSGAQTQQNTPKSEAKKCKSPPPVGYSMDNPVFEDAPGSSLMLLPAQHHPVHVRFLATGNSFRDMEFTDYRGKTTIGKIVREVCRAIWDILLSESMLKISTELMKQIAKDFDIKTNFPNCMGALDGKHIRICCPAHSGSLFYNYKGYNSIVLLALVDSKYRFVYVDIGSVRAGTQSGRYSDSIKEAWRRLVQRHPPTDGEDRSVPGLVRAELPAGLTSADAQP
ncbi:hypothetical protein MSG28_009370, partial [Choristoneura fumiferana]